MAQWWQVLPIRVFTLVTTGEVTRVMGRLALTFVTGVWSAATAIIS